MISQRLFLLVALASDAISAFSSTRATAFVGRPASVSSRSFVVTDTGTSIATTTTTLAASAPTIEAPTREETERKTNKRSNQGDSSSNDRRRNENDGDDTIYGDLEYLQDSSESREMDDPFHILLLGSTFEKPKVTVDYVCGSLQYVLGMPSLEAVELASFAEEHGMSCLGTWPREECLSLGKQLQVRDIVCRVVPFAEGGQRGWQAKDSSESNANSAGAGGSSQNWFSR